MKKLIRTSDGITIEIPQNESPNGAYAKQLVDAERAKRKQSYVTKSNENFGKEQDQRAIRFEERELGGEMGMEVIDNAPESAINVGKGIYDVAKNVITSPINCRGPTHHVSEQASRCAPRRASRSRRRASSRCAAPARPSP